MYTLRFEKGDKIKKVKIQLKKPLTDIQKRCDKLKEKGYKLVKIEGLTPQGLQSCYYQTTLHDILLKQDKLESLLYNLSSMINDFECLSVEELEAGIRIYAQHTTTRN